MVVSLMSARGAAGLAIVAGALLIIADASGSSGFLGSALEFMIARVGGDVSDFLTQVLSILNFIASYGGFSVMGGGLLVYVGRRTLGRLVISLGAGMGLFGLLFILGSSLLQGFNFTLSLLLLMSQSLAWIGVILSIIAAILARRK